MTFKQYINEDKYIDIEQKIKEGILTLTLEHQVYKLIPGTRNSYREDPANTNSKTLKHAHIYAKPNGNGKQLYSVNIDGTGHDGCSGTTISTKHADFFTNKGYSIDSNLTLESIDEALDNYEYYILLED